VIIPLLYARISQFALRKKCCIHIFFLPIGKIYEQALCLLSTITASFKNTTKKSLVMHYAL